MVVGRSDFESVVEKLSAYKVLSLDTETTGLRPYHGHRLFSIILAPSSDEAYYFNFQPYEGLGPDQLLTPRHIKRLKEAFFDKPEILWYMANGKYDMSILHNEGVEIAGQVHCTTAMGRVEYNEQPSFDLDSQLKRFGAAPKDKRVEEWIEENGAWEWEVIPGRKNREKNKFYYKVPFPLITEYALYDAKGTYLVGDKQAKSIFDQSEECSRTFLPTAQDIADNERKLLKTVYRMEREGVYVDRKYCEAAGNYEKARADLATAKISAIAGEPYKSSWQFHAKLFADQKEKWQYNEPTKTGQVNPCFDNTVLPTFDSPAAKEVLLLRDAQSRYQFYSGFLYHADAKGRVHPHFNQHGATHGRFSSSEPNFQNLTSEDVLTCGACGAGFEEIIKACEKCDSTDLRTPDWMVRRAIIAPPGFFILAVDYSTMEYRFMLELACRYIGRLTPLAKRILAGEDYHQATADLATQTLRDAGSDHVVKRGQAKTSNFLSLYGGGDAKLAGQLGIPLRLAQLIRSAIKDAAPEIAVLQRQMIKAAETRGYVRNWLGRRCYFPNRDFAYVAPNYLVAGGCADVVKLAMNELDEFLKPYKSKMVLQVHDEIMFYMAEGEEFLIPEIKRIMESVFPHQYIPLTTNAYTSRKSWADLEEWTA